MPRLEETPAALPGTIILTTIHGPVGAVVSLGQWMTGDASRYTHAGICDGDGGVIEAAPGGVRRVPVTRYLDGRPVAFGWMIPVTMQQRDAIVVEAVGLLGSGYSFLTYGYLALARFGLRPAWLRKRVADSDKMICSAMVDRVYSHAGIKLFDDQRIFGDVTPGDLANRFIDKDWAASTVRPPVSP